MILSVHGENNPWLDLGSFALYWLMAYCLSAFIEPWKLMLTPITAFPPVFNEYTQSKRNLKASKSKTQSYCDGEIELLMTIWL